MSNRDHFLWRPNDNSSRTNLRYELEAAHWARAFNSASVNTTVSLSKALGFIGIVLSLIFATILFVIIILIDLVKYFFVAKRALKEWSVRRKNNAIIEKERAIIEKENALKMAAKKEKERILLLKEEKRKEDFRTKLKERPPNKIIERDALFKEAAQIVVTKQKASISLLQFELKVGFGRVCEIIDQLEAAWIISGFNHKMVRKVLIPDEILLNLMFLIENERNY